MFPLMKLSSEILEQILVKTEYVEDVVSLGSTCVRLKGILSNLRVWRYILAKAELVEHGQVMEDRVRTITAFLGSLPDCEAIYSLLRKTIYERYPGTVRDGGTVMDMVTVLFPGDPQHHSVTLLGLRLLVLADRETAGHTVLKVELSLSTSNHVLSLASLQKEIGELVLMGGIICIREEEGMALCSAVERSSTWRIGRLFLMGEVGGETWRRLGREAARGWLGRVRIERVVGRRGRREDLRAVWGRTKVYWLVDGEFIQKADGEEEGWGRIEERIM